MSNIQKFSWGQIEWIHAPSQDDENMLHIGISTMNPHAVQPRHIHCGDEQTLYILSGEGKQRINGEDLPLEPGKIFHIPAGASHESVNASDEPIIKLLISTPAKFDNKLANLERDGVKLSTVPGDKNDRVKRLKNIVNGLQENVLKDIKMPLSVWDHTQELIYINNEFPEFCLNCCRINEKLRNCVLYTYIDFYPTAYYSDAYAYVCPYGVSIYNLQIVYKKKTLGYLKAGHVRVGCVGQPDMKAKLELPYDVPQSTVSGILDALHKLADAISKLYLLDDMETKISHKQEQIFDKQRNELILIESLKNSQDNFLNSQINQHFLFNILNSITSLALKENAVQTCAAIGELSKLFRYTGRTVSRLVPLAEELNHVRAYTNLQKLRYGDRLKIHIGVQDELELVSVPFNFLQPIVENSFNHAFRETKKEMMVDIGAKFSGDLLEIEILDNGKTLSSGEVENMLGRIKKNNSGGLGMVSRKLASLYGRNFKFNLSLKNGGLLVSLAIPCRGVGDIGVSKC